MRSLVLNAELHIQELAIFDMSNNVAL